jgi:hypothetical protein
MESAMAPYVCLHAMAKALVLLGTMMLAASWLKAQSNLPDLVRLADPEIPVPNGTGWSVEPQTGRLAVAVPIGKMPGEISFPISKSPKPTSCFSSS